MTIRDGEIPSDQEQGPAQSKARFRRTRKIAGWLGERAAHELGYIAGGAKQRWTEARDHASNRQFKAAAQAMFWRPKVEGEEKSHHVRNSALSLSVLALGAVGYLTLSQIINEPNTTATYDHVMPPVGKGPVTFNGKPGYGSFTIAVTAAQIEDEINRGWCPSARFAPYHLRTDTCAYQQGEQQMYAEVVYTFKQQIGYYKTINRFHYDLMTATGDIQFHPDVWMPVIGSTGYYRQSVSMLRAYNEKLAAGNAGMSLRPDNLDRMMEMLVRETGNEVDTLRDAPKDGTFLLVGGQRAAYFHALGVYSVVCETMKALTRDYAKVINDQNAGDAFKEATDQACAFQQRNPPILYSLVGRIDSYHVSLIGTAAEAYTRLSRARTALAAGPGGR